MIRRANECDAALVAKLAGELWPESDEKELFAEMEGLLASDEACLLLSFEGDEVAGFAQCQLRHDYVEGTDSSPVGYLEGIYVCSPYRKRGMARKLLACCEEWARACGCSEFASDCELGNETSLAFHLKSGFVETNRIICFAKKLG